MTTSAELLGCMADPFTIDPMKLKDIPVWGTAPSGKKFQSPT